VPAAKRRVLPKVQATRLPPQVLLRRGYDLAKKLPTFTAAFRRRAFGKRDRHAKEFHTPIVTKEAVEIMCKAR
jgi:hypothetical protein